MSQIGNLTFTLMVEGSREAENQKINANAKSGGFLMALASALGKMIDSAANDLKAFSETLGKSPTAQQSTELTAKSQMFSLFMNNASTVIKTIGEANAGMARKQ